MATEIIKYTKIEGSQVTQQEADNAKNLLLEHTARYYDFAYWTSDEEGKQQVSFPQTVGSENLNFYSVLKYKGAVIKEGSTWTQNDTQPATGFYQIDTQSIKDFNKGEHYFFIKVDNIPNWNTEIELHIMIGVSGSDSTYGQDFGSITLMKDNRTIIYRAGEADNYKYIKVGYTLTNDNKWQGVYISIYNNNFEQLTSDTEHQLYYIPIYNY